MNDIVVPLPIAIVPFFIHVYAGEVPPFAALTENVTVVPSHTLADGLTLMFADGVSIVSTLIDLDPLTDDGNAHDALLVMVAVITSPFDGMYAYALPLPVTVIPFTFHS
jgi:hypothetical protein